MRVAVAGGCVAHPLFGCALVHATAGKTCATEHENARRTKRRISDFFSRAFLRAFVRSLVSSLIPTASTHLGCFASRNGDVAREETGVFEHGFRRHHAVTSRYLQASIITRSEGVRGRGVVDRVADPSNQPAAWVTRASGKGYASTGKAKDCKPTGGDRRSGARYGADRRQ